MKTTLTLIAAATAAAAIAVSPTAHAAPATPSSCDAVTWPRPVPDVVGMMFEPVIKEIPAGSADGALACWDNIRDITQDGQDASKGFGGWDRITAISPTPGTPVGPHDLITVQLAPMDYHAPAAFRPCDWVSTQEVADVFGMPQPIETDGYVAPGSVAPDCTYRSPGHSAVSSTLYVTGAFPVDAAAEYAHNDASGSKSVDGLGLAARCLTNLHGAQDRPYNDLLVLLDGNRMFEARGLAAQPCDALERFARKAIGRL
jgi:hypothetical protein